MRYALAVLTHGDNADVLSETINSFDDHVSPPPVARYVVQDGPCALPPIKPYPWTVLTADRQRGYCTATGMLWQLVAHGNHEYVFWLEHDFTFRRSIDLVGLANTLDENPDVAQMALVRGAVNDEETESGGLVEMYRDRGHEWRDRGRWLQHTSYFTTNPSLMTRAFIAERTMPLGPFCEGKLGIELIEEGFTYGAWGGGEPWVDHIGVRTGKGY